MRNLHHELTADSTIHICRLRHTWQTHLPLHQLLLQLAAVTHQHLLRRRRKRRRKRKLRSLMRIWVSVCLTRQPRRASLSGIVISSVTDCTQSLRQVMQGGNLAALFCNLLVAASHCPFLQNRSYDQCGHSDAYSCACLLQFAMSRHVHINSHEGTASVLQRTF